MALHVIGVYIVNSLLLRNISLVRAILEDKFRISVRPDNILYSNMGEKLLLNFGAKCQRYFIILHSLLAQIP